MIKAFIFDCFGVSVDPVFESFWGKLGEDAKQQIRDVDELADIGDISDAEREKEVAEILGRGGLDGAYEIQQAYFNSHRRQDLLDFIKKSRANFKTGLLSNVSDNIGRIFTKPERAELFDDEVLSYQVRLTKPNPEIYKLAAQRLNVDTTECVFVDDKEVNTIAAENVGMRSILYQDFDQFKKDLAEILEAENARTA